MWGALIGVAGQIAGGIMSNKAAQDQRDYEQNRYDDERARLLAEKNQDPMQRSENAVIMNEYDRNAKRALEQVQNVGTIMGSTPNAMLAERKRIGEGRQQMAEAILKGESRRRDGVQSTMDKLDERRDNQISKDYAAQQNAYANLVSNASSAAGAIMDADGGGKLWKKIKEAYKNHFE